MSRRRLRDAQTTFAGGLNTSAADLAVQEVECRRLTNCHLDFFGSVEKRRGTQRLSTAVVAAAPVRGGFSWNRDTAATQQVVVANGAFYHTTYTGLPVTWSNVAGAFSSTAHPIYAPFRDGSGEVLYLADGGPLNKWDGTTLSVNLASTPNVTALAVYNQRLFGITGTDQTLYWSTLNNGDSLGVTASGGGSAVIRTFGDQKVTALGVMSGNLLVFHVSGISIFRGWTLDDINIAAGATGVTSDVGSISPRSVVSLENQVLFFSQRGVYRINSGGEVDLLSLKINPDLTSGLTEAQVEQVIGCHVRGRREVWFHVPTKGIYVYRYDYGTWSGPLTGGYLTPNTVVSLWEAEDSAGKPIVLAGDSAGWVKECDRAGVYLDDVASNGTGGTSYTATVKTRRLHFGEPVGEKSFRWGALHAELGGTGTTVRWTWPTGTETYSPQGTGAWGGGTWGTGVWGGTSEELFHLPLSGRGHYLELEVTDNTVGPFRVVRAEAEAFDMGRRAF